MNRAIQFPPNFDWVTNTSHAFKVREFTPAQLQLCATSLLMNDAHFRHVMRQCREGWLLSVTLGKDTLHVNIYDPAKVDDPRHEGTSSVNRKRSGFYFVDRNYLLVRQPEERVEKIMTTHPEVYSYRQLRPVEIELCDRICSGEMTEVWTLPPTKTTPEYGRAYGGVVVHEDDDANHETEIS